MHRILIYDLKCGIAVRWKIIVIAFVFTVVTNIVFLTTIQELEAGLGLSMEPGWMDFMLNMFHGMKKYIPNPNNKFEIPIAYIGQLIITAFLIGDYIVKDINHGGIQVLVRNKSRVQWIISKMLWSVIIIIIFYGSSMVINLVFSMFRISPNHIICEYGVGLNIGNFGMSAELLFAVMVLPVLTAITIAQIQMTVSLLFSPVVGFLSAAAIGVLSAYHTTPFLIGNLGMIHRNKLFLQNGIDTPAALMINIGIIISMFVIQITFIKRKNIII